jgi:hypothetical protein
MPWEISYWLLAEKWLPPYWPPHEWQIRDGSIPMQHAPIPEGFAAPWWLYPKSQWPYDTIPWEPKIFGAFHARKVMMNPENVQSFPPFGIHKVKTPTHHPHSIGSVKIHMRPPVWLDISPHPSLWAEAKLYEALRIMSQKRPIKLQMGSGSITIKSIRSANWRQHKNDRPFAAQTRPAPSPQSDKPAPTKDLFQ